MKSFTFTTLACLMLSAANVEAISSEVDAQLSAATELEHHHVSTKQSHRKTWRAMQIRLLQ